MNEGSKRTNERGSFLVGLLACRASTIDFFSALAAQYKIVFPHRALFAGLAAVLGRLSLSMRLWSEA